MADLKDYNGISLTSSEVEFLEQVEQKIGSKIPCIEDKDKTKAQIAKAYQNIPQAQSVEAVQAARAAQVQAIQAQAAQKEQMARMSLEDLEKMYVGQFFVSGNPAMKAQLQAQLDMLLPMYGESHPSVKQIKEMLDMDENTAKQKAKAMAEYMTQNFKLEAINKEETQKVNMIMFTPMPLEDIEKEYVKYYKSMLTPEYQAQLKVTIDVGVRLFGENDPNVSRWKPILGLAEEQAMQYAKQQAQQVFQNMQVSMQSQQAQQQAQQQLQQQAMQSSSVQRVDVSQFGFICGENHVLGLNISDKGLISLPESIGNLSHLRFLDISQNKLENLPDTFGSLQALEELNLNGTWSSNDDKPMYNELATLPDSFCKLTNLQVFKLEKNGLLSLPDNFGNLTSLTTVELYKNKISKLPDSLGNLSKLERLDLSSNKILALPDSFCKLEKVNTINIGFNLIDKIPDNFEQLNSLEYLYIGANKLTKFHPSFIKLKSLKVLNLDDNQIAELPEDMTEQKLINLSIKKNQLSVLPYFLWQMDTLQKLQLEGNPFPPEEQEIARNDAKTILNYCRQRASIAIMLVYTEVDGAAHRIPEIIKFLESQSEVFAVLEGDESNLPSTDLILFLATAGTISVPECIQILKKGKEQDIKVVPLKGLDVGWGDLADIGLSRELGHEYTPDDFNGFCENMYSYVQLLKRSHDIFKDKTALIRKMAEKEVGDPQAFATFKAELSRIIHLQDIKDFFNTYKTYLESQYESTVKKNNTAMFFSQVWSMYQIFTQQSEGGGTA